MTLKNLFRKNAQYPIIICCIILNVILPHSSLNKIISP